MNIRKEALYRIETLYLTASKAYELSKGSNLEAVYKAKVDAYEEVLRIIDKERDAETRQNSSTSEIR